jgi:hypothetical protein
VFEGANLAVSGIALAAAGHVILARVFVAIAVANGVTLRRGQSDS